MKPKGNPEVIDFMSKSSKCDWTSPNSINILKDKFPNIPENSLERIRLSFIKSDLPKSITIKEYYSIMKMLRWWIQFSANPLSNIKISKDKKSKKSYFLSDTLMNEVGKIAQKEKLTVTDIINHQLRRFVNEYTHDLSD